MSGILMRLYPWNWLPYLLLAVVGGWFAYDNFVPVLRMHGELVSREPDAVVVRMWGSKLRECRYVGILAYSRAGSDFYRDATITRIDRAATNDTKPRGAFDIGQWRIRPTTDATHVAVYAQHACSHGDLRTTKIAEVAL